MFMPSNIVQSFATPVLVFFKIFIRYLYPVDVNVTLNSHVLEWNFWQKVNTTTFYAVWWDCRPINERVLHSKVNHPPWLDPLQALIRSLIWPVMLVNYFQTLSGTEWPQSVKWVLWLSRYLCDWWSLTYALSGTPQPYHITFM